MEALTDLDAFQCLQQIESRSLEHSGALTREEELSRFWTGVGFRLANQGYLVNLKEVAEILSIPSYTKVPGTKAWVKGLANIRGTLMPIVDLQHFLGQKKISTLKRQRLLVVKTSTLYCGVIVDEVLGLNHFKDEKWLNDVTIDDSLMAPYLNGGFLINDKLWPIFSLFKLATTPLFRHVAL
jgi:twitching motility protein PilI